MKLKPLAQSLLLVSSLALGQAAWSADLLTAYRDAVSYDSQYVAARATLAAGREVLPQARAGLLPNVALSANALRNDVDLAYRAALPGNDVTYNSHGWSVSLSQPLFRWDRWANYHQAETRVAQAETQYRMAGQEVLIRVAAAYFDVLLAQETLAAATASKASIAEQLAEAKRAFEVGTKTVVETHDAQARYDLTTAQEIVAANDLAVKREQLILVTGQQYDKLAGLRPGAALPAPQPANAESWVAQAKDGALPVQVAQAGMTISERELEKARAGHYPTLDLVASRNQSTLGNNVTSGIGTDTKTTVIGVQLTLPLFSGFATQSGIAQAQALRDKAMADLDTAQRAAAQQARQAYLGVVSGLSQVKALEAATVSSNSSLASNKLGFDVGVRTNMDVLNAEAQVTSTRVSLIKARLDTLLSSLKLKVATGTLGEQDVVAINTLLQ